MNQSSKITDLWWEEQDLHVVTEEGVHTVYQGAWIQSRQIEQAGEQYVQLTAACPTGKMLTLDDTYARVPVLNLDETLQGLQQLSTRLGNLARMDPSKAATIQAIEQLDGELG